MMATESLNDEELIGKIQQGYHHAFATLVKRHTTKFYQLAYRYVLNREEAEDIVQTAFLKLWEKPHAWNAKKETRFTTWFYRVIVNLSLDRLKKHKTLPLNDDINFADEHQNQEKDYAHNQQKEQLIQEIQRLPKRQKTAIILCFYEQMSRDQAAKVMKVNIKALESLLMRAKKNLKGQLPWPNQNQ